MGLEFVILFINRPGGMVSILFYSRKCGSLHGTSHNTNAFQAQRHDHCENTFIFICEPGHRVSSDMYLDLKLNDPQGAGSCDAPSLREANPGGPPYS